MANNITHTVFKIFLLYVLIFTHTDLAFAQYKVLCIKSNGDIVARSSKCKKNETKATNLNLPQKGSSGIAAPALSRTVHFDAGQFLFFPAGAAVTVDQACPAGKVSLGGGCTSSSKYVAIKRTFPFDDSPQLWRCYFRNIDSSGQNATVTSFVICGNPS